VTDPIPGPGVRKDTSFVLGGLVSAHPAPEVEGPRLALEPLVASTDDLAFFVIVAAHPGFHCSLNCICGVGWLRTGVRLWAGGASAGNACAVIATAVGAGSGASILYDNNLVVKAISLICNWCTSGGYRSITGSLHGPCHVAIDSARLEPLSLVTVFGVWPDTALVHNLTDRDARDNEGYQIVCFIGGGRGFPIRRTSPADGNGAEDRAGGGSN